MTIACVELDVPIAGPFDYEIGLADVFVGSIVVVPFGRRRVVGVVVGLADSSVVEKSRIRKIERVLPVEPLPALTLSLAAFCADYYRHRLGQALSVVLPTKLRKPDFGIRTLLWGYALVANRAAELETSIPSRAKGQQRLYQALANQAGLDAVQARVIFKGAPRVLRDWTDRGWVDKQAAGLKQSVADKVQGEPPTLAPTLTEEQHQAVDRIGATLGRYVPWVLLGVTGSGKTEVYLSLIERVAAEGLQTLVLVPEINLTPQLVARVQGRFPHLDVVSLHSGLAEGERLARWERARSGQAEIVLGTRLAVFTPLPKLGLVIVDEEHDSSFKQNEGLRYHARDLAIFVANSVGVPVVLGSATPSLETYSNAIEGRYQRADLSVRPAAKAPSVRFVDTRGERIEHGVSQTALTAIARCIEHGEQCLVYINRRGFAPVLVCHACGWMAECRRCSARLTLHSRSASLKCHYCGHEESVTHTCPECGNQDLRGLGQGTQRVEEALCSRFPSARILRVDSDSTRRRGSFAAMRERIHLEKVDILVGTQMLAKGHDFPKLTLVVVLGADHALYSSDFRAGERLFQQLMQVSGRAGRADLPGHVLVQTEFPQHPIYASLAGNDFAAFADSLLKERRSAGFPPYVFQAILRAEAHRESDMWSYLKGAAHKASGTADNSITLYDPVPSPVSRIAGRFRGQLLIQASSRPSLRRFLSRWHPLLEEDRPGAVRWVLDVDPVEL
jgi:primosomal protein N' (replication factor Y)